MGSPRTVHTRTLGLFLGLFLGCKEPAGEAVAGPIHVRAQDAVQTFGAAAVTVSAAYMGAKDEAGANSTIDLFLELAQLGEQGKLDLTEAGQILRDIEDARDEVNMVSIERARPIVARAKSLRDRSR